MAEKKKEKRGWQPRELRLISEYLAKYYGKYPTYTRVRLGAIHPDLLLPELTPEERRMLSVWKRWADAVVVTPTKLILIEGAIFPDPGDISKLLLYRELLKVTPEFEEWRDLPIEMQIVVAIEDPLLSKIARESGILVRVFKPPWIKDYLEIVARRARRAPLTFLGR